MQDNSQECFEGCVSGPISTTQEIDTQIQDICNNPVKMLNPPQSSDPCSSSS